MSDTIKVSVSSYGPGRSLMLRWTDPTSGKRKARSAGTTKRKEAERAAGALEKRLNDASYKAPSKITWEQFRLRYEQEVVSGLAKRTGDKIAGVFNVLEDFLPVVADGQLRELTAARLSAYQSHLREQGRSESTIAGHLAHIRAALQWAVDQDMIPAVPKTKRLKRAKNARGGTPMKGRPITREELERIIDTVPRVLKDDEANARVVEPIRRLLWGLWWSGLRLGEALNLWWDRTDRPCVDLSTRLPMLSFPAEWQKNHQDQVIPMASEFAEFLEATPEAERRGPVFRIPAPSGGSLPAHRVGRLIALAGGLAGVKVYTHPGSGKVKYASSHDCRRAFGERWAARVMPQVLMSLMRHESIQTTMRFYVGRNAQTAADAVWAGYRASGNTFGNKATSGGVGSGVAETAKSFARKGLQK